MAKILFLAHRTPFPPDKGDKIRAFHILRHLADRHDVWLGAGVDDLNDMQHLQTARTLCRDVCLAPLGRVRRTINMACALATGLPLSVARFGHPRLRRWVRRVMLEEQPDIVFVYSSALTRYVIPFLSAKTRLLVDLVDCDAEKWRAYGLSEAAPMRWIYAEEFRRVVRFETAVVAAAEAAIFISDAEARLFVDLVPEAKAKVAIVSNGVDAESGAAPAPSPPGRREIAFCGRMDYRPNIDAVLWFANDILPKILAICPDAVFRIVGAAPAAAVTALAASPAIDVTGTVADVRPHLDRAAVVVTPLRIARGVQNKVLEGMAAGRPVVTTPQALEGIAAQPGRDVLVAHTEEAFAAAVCSVLLGQAPPDLGSRARDFVRRHHRWSAQLEALDRLIARLAPSSSQAAA